MTEKTCGNCLNGEFALTPSGRFKKFVPGLCRMSKEVEAELNAMLDSIPPCVAVPSSRFRWCKIWPDYKADRCIHWKELP